jgi:hypothetical protein
MDSFWEKSVTTFLWIIASLLIRLIFAGKGLKKACNPTPSPVSPGLGITLFLPGNGLERQGKMIFRSFFLFISLP